MDAEIIPGKTLIIFDEVQECPEALNSLKYFYEFANTYHVCAAGSLLGVKLVHTKGFPVGKVNFLDLYPLNFLEFIAAFGEDKLLHYLQTLHETNPLPTNLHDKCVGYLKLFFMVGGMPEAVNTYRKTKNLSKVREVQKDILRAYSLDFAKHAPADNMIKINQVWQAIPSQLAKENKKFVYSVIRKGTRAKEFEAAIQWLTEAGLILKVYNVSNANIPLDAYAKFEFFKIYLLDVGLLGAMTDLPIKTMVDKEQIFQEFRGSFAENYIAQELTYQYEKLYSESHHQWPNCFTNRWH